MPAHLLCPVTDVFDGFARDRPVGVIDLHSRRNPGERQPPLEVRHVLSGQRTKAAHSIPGIEMSST
jgi:hypothetical protein